MARSLKDRQGKYGYAKYRAFTSLEHREWVSSRELTLISGLKYHSISRLLPKWVDHGYIERGMTYQFGIGTYEYRLIDRGRSWLAVARRDLPMASQFQQDLEAWQRYIKKDIKKLMAGKFKGVLTALTKA